MDAVERYRKRRRDRLTERMRKAENPKEAVWLAVIIYNTFYRDRTPPE